LNREITGNFLEKTSYKRDKYVINQNHTSDLCGPLTGNFLRLNREFFTPNREFTGNALRRVGERPLRRPLHTGLLPKIVLHPCDRALEIAGHSRGQCCAYPMIVARSASCVGRPNSANSKPTDQRQTETPRWPGSHQVKMPFNFWIARQADRRRLMRNDAFAPKADCRDSSITAGCACVVDCWPTTRV
jgi:hypothetical protein